MYRATIQIDNINPYARLFTCWLGARPGADLRTYARHGYFGAMRTQIDHGIFDFCGAPVLTSELLLESEQVREHLLDTARDIGRRLFASTAHLPASRTDALPPAECQSATPATR